MSFSVGDRVRVSVEDVDLLLLKWTTRTSNGGPDYLKRTLPRPRRDVYMHREIMRRVAGRNLLGGELVDHKNGDTLDNRRENLRIVSRSENAVNTNGHRDRKSPEKNINWRAREKRWHLKIHRNRKCVKSGYFKELQEAVLIRDLFLKTEGICTRE